MKHKFPLPQEKKLTVIFRVESGNLGPTGDQRIDEFCEFARKEVEYIDSDFVHWELRPRNNKSLPEMEYTLNNKKLSHEKAARYLQLFDKNLNEFEEHFHEKLVQIIEQFMGR